MPTVYVDNDNSDYRSVGALIMSDGSVGAGWIGDSYDLLSYGDKVAVQMFDIPSGWSFNYWYDSYNDTILGYTNPYYFTVSKSYYHIIGYAKRAITYTITLNANGGSGGTTSVSGTGTSSPVSITMPTNVPSRTGYTFQGWSTSSSASSPSYYAGNTYSFSSSQTLYAVWKINTYTISYDANGGSGAPPSQTKTYNVTLTLSAIIPKREGYDFLGWSTSSTATSATYSAGGSFTSNASTKLYAVWRIKTYTISYDANGGSGAPPSQTKKYGTNLTLSTVIPTRDGYVFLGWSTDSSAISPSYSSGATYSKEDSVTLYAVWGAKEVQIFYGYNNSWVNCEAFYGYANAWKAAFISFGKDSSWK